MADLNRISGLRAVSAVLAVCALGLFGAILNYSAAAKAAKESDPYRIGAQKERFGAAQGRLPANAVVGYISDVPTADALGQAMFFGAQYALAPRLLVGAEAGTKPEWWIGSFSKPQDYAAAGAAQGLVLVEDLGQGVVLFRREKR